MAPSRESFKARFRALSPDTATDFLAELYAAQGWSVEQESGRLIIRRDNHARTVVMARTGADFDDADIVVTSGDPGSAAAPDGTEVVTVDDLYERTRYAVDAAASDRLLTTYFDDLPAATEIDATPQPTDDTASDVDDEPDGVVDEGASSARTWSRRAMLVAGGALLGGGATAAAIELDGPGPVPSPGITADGVTDPAALAEA
ncbi:MAG: hypothetical protein ABEH64_07960, partial [Salinirussus sp.]